MTVEGKRENQCILHIYTKLCNGYAANKAEAAQNYCANEISLQRDIDEKRTFLSADSEGMGIINSVVYDQTQTDYRPKRIYNKNLCKNKVIEIGKILLDTCSTVKKRSESISKVSVQLCVHRSNADLLVFC